MRSAELISTLVGHKYHSEIAPVFISESCLVSGREDGTLTVWDLKLGVPSRLFRVTKGAFTLALAPGCRRLATGGHDKNIKIWSLPDGNLLRILKGHSGSVLALAWSPDSRLLASGSSHDDKTVRVWDARKGKQQCCLDGHGMVNSLAFSPRNGHLVSAGIDPNLRLWDASSGEPLGELVGHRCAVNCLSFSFDGKILASCSEDGFIKIWDARRGKKLRTVRPTQLSCSCVVFAPNGRVLASADHESAIRFWDSNTLRRTTVAKHVGNFCTLSFSPSGRLLASASNELPGRIRVWKVT